MTATTRQVFVFLVLWSLVAIANAQSPRTAHTFKLDAPDARPPATLDDVSWLVGSWTGEAFGGSFEEVWNPPSAGSMIGLFKLMTADGEVSFYELLLLVEEEGSLSLKVKHFNPDFTAWEDKAEHVNFRFIKAGDDAIHFSGISFYRVSDTEMHAYLVLRSGDDIREEKLVYRRDMN
jgi:hypothetical protein